MNIVLQIVVTIATALISTGIGYFFGKYRDRNQMLFNKKLEVYSKIISKISRHDYKSDSQLDDLIDLLAPARFLAEKETVNELREYYTLINDYKSAIGLDIIKETADKISLSIMKIEQLMRTELGQERIYDDQVLIEHVNQGKYL